MSDFMLDVGLANELKMSFRRNGWKEEEVKEATKGDFLAHVRRVLLGHAEIIVPEHIIDCDASPFVPDGWSVEEHQKGGAFKWDKDVQKDALYYSKGQQDGKRIKGNQLREVLKNKPVLNACVLDYLLARPHLISKEWKGKAVFFWGTIYCDPNGDWCVRYLYWYDRWYRWFWGAVWLGHDWFGGSPALLASRKSA